MEEMFLREEDKKEERNCQHKGRFSGLFLQLQKKGALI